MAKKSVQKVADWKALKLAGQSILFAGRFEKWGQLTLELLQTFVRLEGGTVADTLNASVSLLVLKEVTGTSSHEKKATLLNTKGASIAVIDADQLRTMLVPTEAEVHAMIQAGPEGYKLLRHRVDAAKFNEYSFRQGGKQRPYTLTKASLRGQNIKDAPLWCMDLEEVDLTNTTVQTESNESYEIGNTRRSKLDGATIHAPFADLIECSCRGADLSNSWVGFLMNKSRCSSDFTKAKLVRFHFMNTDMTDSKFDKADLTDAEFDETDASKVSFREACLKSITTEKASFSGADFTKADLSEAELLGANLRDCNFTKAKLRGARLMGAQFQGACVDGADFTGANVAQADFTGVDLSKAIGLVLTTKQFSIGPKLKELSDIAKKATSFETTMEVKAPQETLRLKAENRWKSPEASWSRELWADTLSDWEQSTKSVADAIVAVVAQWPDATACPHTVQASGKKTGLTNRKLTQLAMEAWCETYGAPCPTVEELKQAEAAAESNRDTIRASLLAELGQPDGVKKWNGRDHLELETIKS
ncbi:MAG TPA: pentapeptide repeat-containing protein, partial [Schlesneria sp.]